MKPRLPLVPTLLIAVSLALSLVMASGLIIFKICFGALGAPRFAGLRLEADHHLVEPANLGGKKSFARNMPLIK